MWRCNPFRRDILARDDTNVVLTADRGNIRLNYDDAYARSATMNLKQARELREALDEAIWFTELFYDGEYELTAEEIRTRLQSCLSA